MAPAKEPFAPRPLAGPYRSLDEFCHQVAAASVPDDDDEAPDRCDPNPGGPAGGPVTLTGAPPFRQVVIFPTYQQAGAPLTACNLGLDAGNGWYVDQAAFYCFVTHLEGEDNVSVTSMKVSRFVGDRDLVIRLSDANSNQGFGRTETSLIVCALGPSGVPSCTPEIPTVTYVDVEDRVVLDVRPEPGAIDITVPPDGLLDEDIPDEWKPLAGRHALVFP